MNPRDLCRENVHSYYYSDGKYNLNHYVASLLLCRHLLNWSLLGTDHHSALDLVEIKCGSRGMPLHCWQITTALYRKKQQIEKDFCVWCYFDVLQLGLCGQEARALLWRQWATVELLMVHLITAAWCLSEDWLRIKHIAECQHVHTGILSVTLSMFSSSICSVYCISRHCVPASACII